MLYRGQNRNSFFFTYSSLWGSCQQRCGWPQLRLDGRPLRRPNIIRIARKFLLRSWPPWPRLKRTKEMWVHAPYPHIPSLRLNALRFRESFLCWPRKQKATSTATHALRFLQHMNAWLFAAAAAKVLPSKREYVMQVRVAVCVQFTRPNSTSARRRACGVRLV